jgi:hypothetical protein
MQAVHNQKGSDGNRCFFIGLTIENPSSRTLSLPYLGGHPINQVHDALSLNPFNTLSFRYLSPIEKQLPVKYQIKIHKMSIKKNKIIN